MKPELAYVLLLFALFVVPKLLLRYRVPTAATEVALGAAAGMGLGWFQHDTTVTLLASLGIISLFLFAGLEVDVRALVRHRAVLLQHLGIATLFLVAGAWAAAQWLGFEPRSAALLSLAILTPSTGFILSSIGSMGFGPNEMVWIKSKTIATELLALLALFAVIQSSSLPRLALATAALGGLIAVLPLVFRGFASTIARYAPRSEFAFLLMLAVVCGYATRELGVYYLVGAFVVGWAASRFRDGSAPESSEALFHSVELFATFFVPFYFFAAGLHLRPENFSAGAFVYGGVFLAAGVPIRALAVALHRRVVLREPLGQGMRIGLSLSPTLVFCLVLAEILRDRHGASAELYGGLVLYALASSLVPVLTLHARPPEGDLPALERRTAG